MIQLGIIGLPSSGKTTLFKTLTGVDPPREDWSGGGRIQIRAGVVDIPDPRLDALSEMQRPRKTTHARITYADVGGLRVDPGQHGFPGSFTNQLEAMHGLLLVVRAFEDPAVSHPSGSVDPLRDFATMQAEFLLHDMLAVERSLESFKEQRQKRGTSERAELDRRIALFERFAAALGENCPLRGIPISRDEGLLLTGYGLLTHKPMLVVVSIAEGDSAPDLGSPDEGLRFITLQGKLEMEIAQLPPEDVASFIMEYGLVEPGRDRVIRASCDLLSVQSFFTVSDPEVRAWILEKGNTALQAADTIHSDMARGFIRAEVIPWNELIEHGGLAQARGVGKLRLEGRDYVMADGDVIYVRFNI